jgi:putative tryptophan/tyrosine transport system substrate-binding protein
MKRRAFIILLGGAAAWPLAVRAQQPAMPVIGVLVSGSAEGEAGFLAFVRQGLGETGYVEGRNVAIEYRYADEQYDRLPALAAELVRQRAAVIYATGNVLPALAAKAATATIPIVFANGSDPVALGLVASLSRPGGNATGVSFNATELASKKLELLHELVPRATVVALLVNPRNPNSEPLVADTQAAAKVLGVKLLVVNAVNAPDLDAAFATIVQQRADALVVGTDVLFNGPRRTQQLITLAAVHAVPTMFNGRDRVTAGGLISYGTDVDAMTRQAGVYIGRILKGEKPGDLPVMQPTKFELIINLKTAKTLGLTVPPSILAIADEVIE